ncbi:exported hypothetical protein [Cupriavidus necator]|uniref:Uncharacterized protein n=1 Tax=Cupriavidus necator TaxID=106590 RepID=A0A1K0JK53_CUPNE|nr:exported hypothetical protein [Cupriavidus necator]
MASWPNARQWLFSLKAFAAAMLALYIALALGLPESAAHHTAPGRQATACAQADVAGSAPSPVTSR